MGSTFQELATAVRETRIIGLQTLARLTHTGLADAEELADMRARKERLAEAAELLEQLCPHETLVRSIVKVGALVDFPDYSSDLTLVRVGAHALVRGIVREDLVDQCQVEFAAPRSRTGAWVGRGTIVGVERMPPALWRR
jgi:hypothetical protein